MSGRGITAPLASCPHVSAALDAFEATADALQGKGILPASRTLVIARRFAEDGAILLHGRASAANPLAQMALLDAQGREIAGSVAGLGDSAAILLALLGAKPHLDLALFASPPNVTAFAVARRSLPIVYGTTLLKLTDRDLPLAHWNGMASRPAFEQVLADNPAAPAALLANRGVLVWGQSELNKLARLLEGIEETAAISIRARILGGARGFPPGAHDAMQKSLGGD